MALYSFDVSWACSGGQGVHHSRGCSPTEDMRTALPLTLPDFFRARRAANHTLEVGRQSMQLPLASMACHDDTEKGLCQHKP